MRIQNGILLTMEGERFEKGYVDFENGVITSCGALQNAPAYCGKVLDADGGYILPGLIDAHTHIGISEEGLRWEGEDCNETTSPVTPDVRAVDGFNPFDTAIPKARGRRYYGSRCAGKHERDRRADCGDQACRHRCREDDLKSPVRYEIRAWRKS